MSKPSHGVGIYGGSFDPVHIGHLRSALEVKQQLNLDELRFIPTGNPPHRSRARVDPVHRLAMLELAIADAPGLVIDPREINAQKPSYTFETLESIQNEYPQAELTLIIGTDQISVFDTWHRWRELLQLAQVAVMERPGESLSEVAQQILRDESSNVILCPVTQLDISSTRIRRELQQGTDIQFLVPYAVRDYINQHRLYIGSAD